MHKDIFMYLDTKFQVVQNLWVSFFIKYMDILKDLTEVNISY